ncbi:hypothetical protein SERLA73DRAFT_73441 [Serpula lacrymans var. lacrymans S7.3]|uniref:Uncharacterized protein n=2 Tax=Serpula lacrymans var. lacrymans TaxID=341189 RepID=F8PY90_SERL3|nr:uncharacterized protein SERLADRAFT_438050 [Serpula lacrymans var. lacrymans S7.9]EGN98853.1 hypothetical protein SERLA73DRAFT_73441 [Serpula lacrymans var. lacrymans S7.3]EGO24437.1 hypothetical protein SERLADRAFT_438050 [Serpula lacrymans var. lacrymans S7.9]
MSYPYPCPNQSQPVPLSPYSSLDDALGPRNTHSDRFLQTIYSNTDHSTTSSTYPYPVKKVLPNHASVDSENYHDSPPIVPSHSLYGLLSAERPRPVNIPANYTLLPQPAHDEELSHHTRYGTIRLPHILFQRRSGKPPYGVNELLHITHMPSLAGGDDKVLEQGERQIKVKVIWPGYSQFPFEKRIKTQNGEISRGVLLVLLAQALDDCVTYIRSEDIAVERGYEKWAIRTPRNGLRGISAKDCLITGMTHRAGSTWQPEIYVPRL